MTHTYKVSGMTCQGCQAKVQSLLSKVNGVKKVNIDLANGEASIDMERHIPTNDFKAALKDYPKYQITEPEPQPQSAPAFIDEEQTKPWVETYKPILLIFAYIIGITLVVENASGGWNGMRWMNNFMGAFFLVFSFFKLLNLKGFAESYAMYDVIAKKWNGWGYIYPFVELLLGVAFLSRFNLPATNIVTLVVMAVSIIGVLQSVLSKRKIKCACLGDVFNLPMSTVTIIEDGLMIAMSAAMIIKLI